MKISDSMHWSKPFTDTHGKCSVEDGILGSFKYSHSSLSIGYTLWFLKSQFIKTIGLCLLLVLVGLWLICLGTFIPVARQNIVAVVGDSTKALTL